ncbi:MAG TPA: nitroreductase family deazaflavin-dependent oxidoreductase [Acidimicrobiia bacterium]
MASQEEVFDSPSGWVSKHIDEYVETDGQKGYEWRNGAPTLLLTTRGRKTGKLRRTALIFGVDGDRYVLVASVGGAAKNPAWYLNLVANPDVELQVKAEKVKGRARTASAEEKPRLWQLMAAIWPDYDSYQTKTEREIPVVIVERV